MSPRQFVRCHFLDDGFIVVGSPLASGVLCSVAKKWGPL